MSELRAQVINLLQDAWELGYECGAKDISSARTVTLDAMTDTELAEHGLVRLPVDADGEPIRVGDVMDSRVDYLFDGKPFTVRALVLCEDGWEAADGRFGNRYEPDSLHHHHAPTVEDVLSEMLDAVDDDRYGQDRIIAEYASKLRLAGDGKEG